MIKVDIVYRDEHIVSFSVEGHAGYAQSGNDIYCAGVSAITQTALLGLLNKLEQTPYYKIEKGCLLCDLGNQLSGPDQEKAQIILSTMEMGLRAMQESYGEHLNITVRRI